MMKRFGQLIKLQPGQVETYSRYHANIWAEVAKTIADCNIRNYSIYHKDGFLFAYFEYVGKDYEADMARMGEDPKTQEWWAIMKPLQDPLPTRSPGEWWADMAELFHQD
jgi:L-rhamnose mutarotase